MIGTRSTFVGRLCSPLKLVNGSCEPRDDGFEFVRRARETFQSVSAKLRIVEMALHVADSERQSLDRVL